MKDLKKVEDFQFALLAEDVNKSGKNTTDYLGEDKGETTTKALSQDVL
jgi:hypothetical protein